MVELSSERVEQMLHEETMKTEELATILRSIYTRYLRLYEKYFADIDALDDDKIAEFRSYNEETISLAKYYCMDIPVEICTQLNDFEDEYGSKLLGPGWHEFVYSQYEAYKEENGCVYNSEETFKAEFEKHVMTRFYDVMGYIFREGFETHSQVEKNLTKGLTEMWFGK